MTAKKAQIGVVLMEVAHEVAKGVTVEMDPDAWEATTTDSLKDLDLTKRTITTLCEVLETMVMMTGDDLATTGRDRLLVVDTVWEGTAEADREQGLRGEMTKTEEQPEITKVGLLREIADSTEEMEEKVATIRGSR